MPDTPDAGARAPIARFADPRLGLLASREELAAWVAEGAALDPPLGPEAAIRRMVPTKHVGLVTDIAVKFVGRGMDLDDLIGEGTLGLIHAARYYDPSRLHGTPPAPIRFGTYATWAVRRHVSRGVRDRGRWIRLPEHLQKHLGPNPPIGPLTRWEAEGLEDARRADARRVVSMSPRPGEDRPAILAHVVAREEDPVGMGEECERLLATLSERERRVVMERAGFFGPIPTYPEMVARAGVKASWQSIQHVEQRAIKKLRAAARRMTHEDVFGEARR